MAASDNANRDPEFEKFFADDAQGGNATGMDLDEAGESAEDGNESEEGAPAAVVIVADAAPGSEDGAPAAGADAAGEEAANQSAAAQAQEANDQANAARDQGSTPTTGQQEAGGMQPAEGSPAEEATESPAVEAAEDAAGEPTAAAQPADKKAAPMTEQQLRSWEGRLKKMEADLKTASTKNGEPVSDTAGDAIDTAASQASAAGNNDQAAALEKVADQVESGELSVEEGLKQLAEDFGEPFVKTIQAVAAAAARDAAQSAVGERLGKLQQDTQGIIDHLKSSAERDHFQQIYDAHPDFMDVYKDPAFMEFANSTGKQDVVENGNAKAINKLISAFKDSRTTPADKDQASAAQPGQDAAAAANKAATAANQGAVDAAEGVRSAGLRLPEKPGKANDDYESAWKEF